MFKLVVLCAFFAAAAAKPDFLIPAPITQYSSFLTPGSTVIAKSDSSVIHPSPLFYQESQVWPGLTHLIKKRSPQFPLTYAAPWSYLDATAYNTPLIHSSQILSSPFGSVPAVHLIKKRSPALLPTTYYASPSTYAATPLLASPYTATASIYTQTPLISQPLAYTQFIKK